MSASEQNIASIVDYFKSGIKSADEPGRLGVEIEHFIVDDHSRAVSYYEEHGVRWVLEQLEGDLPEKVYGDGGALLGLAGGNKAISLEPAAQFEISAGPYDHAGDLNTEYLAFQRHLNHILSGHNRRIVAIGYHPSARVDELPLIPKQRYRFMDAHFAEIGHFGRCMMRGSAATQISIDYYSEQDCLRKLRLSSALSPLLSLLCDNSPIFEGKPRTHHMVRTEIWQKCDPARCGAIPGVFDEDFSLEAYASYILRTPAIFAYDEDGNAFATEKSFGEIYEERPMTHADIEHALSMFFNDSRLKTYIEIRPADSMPIPFVSAYATLIKALFYADESLAALDELLGNVRASDVDAAKNSLMDAGYEGHAYGRTAAEMIDTLFDIAGGALPPLEKSMMNPLLDLARRRKTLAMMAL